MQSSKNVHPSKFLFRLATDWCINLTGKPSIEQLEEWQANSVEITVEVKGYYGNSQYQGSISEVNKNKAFFTLDFCCLGESGYTKVD